MSELALNFTAAAPAKRGLLRKLTFASGAVAALTVALIAVFMIYSQQQTTRGNMDARARDIARQLDKAATFAALEDPFAFKEAATEMVKQNSDILYLVLTERDGHSIVKDRAGWTDLLSGSWIPKGGEVGTTDVRANALPGFESEQCLHYTHPVALTNDAGDLWGWLHIGLTLDGYRANVQRTMQITAAVAGGTFTLAALLSFLLARNITSPIRSLQEFAQRVAAGATSARVEVKSNDEIGDLAESINTMIGSLATSQESLRKSLAEQTSLREKDILLREIHHRVKNNMQMLSSLMRLQSRRAGSEESREILRQSEARIRSMGLIHEKLYQSDSLSSIDMHGYLNTLTSELIRVGQSNSGGRREIRLAVSGIQLGIDTALPCGLIVTELVQNALKYAFPDSRDGVILVSLSKNQAAHHYSLIVWDNGVGIRGDFDPSTSTSLGTRLVRMLTDQLHGQLSISGQQGTRIEITFTESQYRDRI
jgi:two-component sensor histidine kinase